MGKEYYAKGASPRKADKAAETSMEETVEGLKQGLAITAAGLGIGAAAAGIKTLRDREKSKELRRWANKPFNRIKIKEPHNF